MPALRSAAALATFAFIATAQTSHAKWADTATTASDLHARYGQIFPHHNRNAASHLWATFLLDRSAQLTTNKLEYFFGSFCPVSGSPVTPGDRGRYKVPVKDLKGESKIGLSYMCCAPCQCDLQDFVRTDTKKVRTKSGVRTYNMLVIGDPCKHKDMMAKSWTDAFSGQPTSLKRSAPELNCTGTGGTLGGATLSDNGHVIIGMHIALNSTAPTAHVNDATSKVYRDYCTRRAAAGYSSGMGMIFRKVAMITPIAKAAVSVSRTAPTFDGDCASTSGLNAYCRELSACSPQCKQVFDPWYKQCKGAVASFPDSLRSKVTMLGVACGEKH